MVEKKFKIRRNETEKKMVFVQWKHVQERHKINPASHLCTASLTAKDHQCQFGRYKCSLYKKGCNYEAKFLDFWNFHGEISV